jgi:hypothetical protein
MSCPIPIDLNIQKHWRNHELVTDEMVAWFKKQINCQPYQGIMDVGSQRHKLVLSRDIPEGKVAWMLVDNREGFLNIYEKQIFYTDCNGRNPTKIFN